MDDAIFAGPEHRIGVPLARRHIGEGGGPLHRRGAGHTVEHRHQHGPVHGLTGAEQAGGALHQARGADIVHRRGVPLVAGDVLITHQFHAPGALRVAAGVQRPDAADS